MSLQFNNKQLRYPLSGSFTGSFTGSFKGKVELTDNFILSGTYLQNAGTSATPWILNTYSTGASNYSALINAPNGISGFRVDTNGQAQYVARSTSHSDRELRFQMYSDGNTYFGTQGLLGDITSDLIIRTSADSGTNAGSIKFSLMGSQKMAITPAGIQITNTSLDVNGNVTITGSLNVSNGITGSFSGDGSGLTNLPVVNINTGSLVTTASFNAYTASIQSQVNSLTSATSSYVQNSQTSSMSVLSSSFATTASYLSGYVSPFPFTGSAIISGSLTVTGSTNLSGASGATLFSSNADTLVMTGSFNLSGSMNIVGLISGTASFAVSASYIDGGFY